MYPPPPAKSGFRVGWIFAFIGIGLFGAIIFAVLLFAARTRRGLRDRFPSMPPNQQVASGGEEVLNGDTEVSGPGQTVITKTFAMGTGASLSITNTNGRIHVESWDGPGIQARITKSSGSESARRRVPIFQQMAGNRLSLRSGDPRNSSVDVSYELKVPKEMGRLDITSANGSIKLDGVSGDINVNSMDGSIDLSNISGAATAKNMNGSISAVFEEVDSDRPMSFTNMNGSIKLTFKSDVNANLKANTTTGTINVDPGWGIEVKKGLIGARAEGLMGTGGQPLKVETMNGSITITKVPGSAGH